MPDIWRERIPRKKPTRNTMVPDDPIVIELLKGNTVVVDAHIALEDYRKVPYKNLYNALAVRGLRLRKYLFDDVDNGIYRGLIMWAEPFVRVVTCSRCGNIELTSQDTMPSRKGCESRLRFHRWKDLKRTQVERKEEEAA